jgi:hypothetical protein
MGRVGDKPGYEMQMDAQEKDTYVYSVILGSDDVADTCEGQKERKSAKPWTWLLKQIAVKH